jgi:hypothetical protein
MPLPSVRVYLVGYIIYIIDCHMCQDIFGRIYILNRRLPYVSKVALPLKTLIFYIYRLRGTMNKQETIPQIEFFLHQEIRARWALIQSRNGLHICIKINQRNSSIFIRIHEQILLSYFVK